MTTLHYSLIIAFLILSIALASQGRWVVALLVAVGIWGMLGRKA